uniref:UMP-CMP kinase 2, mitochondrial n=1 Tax=Crocodylus porosus TaxID=8502 RepID=A0A7M4EM67_CROPO
MNCEVNWLHQCCLNRNTAASPRQLVLKFGCSRNQRRCNCTTALPDPSLADLSPCFAVVAFHLGPWCPLTRMRLLSPPTLQPLWGWRSRSERSPGSPHLPPLGSASPMELSPAVGGRGEAGLYSTSRHWAELCGAGGPAWRAALALPCLPSSSCFETFETFQVPSFASEIFVSFQFRCFELETWLKRNTQQNFAQPYQISGCTSLIPEAKAVLDLVDTCPKHPKKGDFPVIVIEGLDATGKTTVTQSLKESLNAILLRSPPACISQWRKTFDDKPNHIRRAFYALGNYLVALEIAKASIESPVIVDRYWHSTAAYAIATEISGKVQNLPPEHHEVYQWPEDLLKPDLVLLLTVSPEERIRRLKGRGLEKTKEETELEANSLFREKVEEAYKRMENPECQEVDANPSREEVLKTILQLIKNHCSS